MKKPPGTRSTIGAAKRLLVRQRIVPQSLICSVAGSAYLRNWISGTGIRPASAMPTARPTMPSSLRLVSNTRSRAELLLQAERHRVDAALGPDILAEHQHARVGLELLVEHAADRGDHVDALAFGRRLVGRAAAACSRCSTGRRPAASRLRRRRCCVTVSGDGDAARLGLGARRLDLPRGLALEVRPLLVADLQLGAHAP